MPPLPPGGEAGTGADGALPVEPTKPGVPARVNPYSVIDITPFQEEQPPPPAPEAQEESASPPVPSGYSVPVPCGYAVPSGLPALLPAYSSPVIVRAASLDEDGRARPLRGRPRAAERVLRTEQVPSEGPVGQRGQCGGQWASTAAFVPSCPCRRT